MGAAKQIRSDPVPTLRDLASLASAWDAYTSVPAEAPIVLECDVAMLKEEAQEELAIPAPKRVRSKTLSVKRLSKKALRQGTEAYPRSESALYKRPVTRGDCLQGENAARPCPWVSCKHHLKLDVSAVRGSITDNHPHLEVEAMGETCSLDVADRGGITLEEVGEIMGLTRERIRQMETVNLAKLKELCEIAALQDYLDEPERRGPYAP